MRAVIQRVSEANVEVDGEITGAIQSGFLILLGVEEADEGEDAEWLCKKILSLRVFPDEEGKMNRDIHDIDGSILVVSQFTLHAKTKKGTRPSFIRAAHPSKAEALYEDFCNLIEVGLGKPCQKGIFGAHMEVKLTNDGPVTLLIDTKNKE